MNKNEQTGLIIGLSVIMLCLGVLAGLGVSNIVHRNNLPTTIRTFLKGAYFQEVEIAGVKRRMLVYKDDEGIYKSMETSK